jgi:phosphatidylglycerophosphatase A
MKGVAVFIASFGYVGFFPIAPGTAGSLAALALFAFIRWIGVPVIELSAIVAVFAIGVWAAQGTEAALARKDPGVVVIDEVLGMLITLALLPLSLTGIALGFLFFRVLDVIKPYPAAQLEHLHGGLGIMADDAVAGLYAHIALRACVWMVPAWLTA